MSQSTKYIITCCEKCEPLLPAHPHCRDVSCECHTVLTNTGDTRRRFYQMGYDEGFKDGESNRVNDIPSPPPLGMFLAKPQNTHDSLREEFKEAYSKMPENFESVHPDCIADWWLSKFSTHTQEQLEGLLVEIKFNSHDMGEMGKFVRLEYIINILTSRLSNIKKK